MQIFVKESFEGLDVAVQNTNILLYMNKYVKSKYVKILKHTSKRAETSKSAERRTQRIRNKWRQVHIDVHMYVCAIVYICI